MAPSMELDYRLRWMDFDKHGRIQPFAVFDIIQDIATWHAEEMGIGRDSMVEKGVFWAVIRQKYEVVRAPHRNEVVKVRTWPHSPTRFSFRRDFAIFDQEGELLIKATSEWVVMDLETRKFASVTDYYEPGSEFDEARMFERKPRKIADFEEGNRPDREIVPSYSDIDLNGHVNNARYGNYVIDALNPDGEGQIKSLQVDYRHEVLPGAPLVVKTLVEEDRVLSKGVREDGAIAFACAIEL